MTRQRCPDCGVEMASVTVTTNDGFSLNVTTDEKREGVLGTLGISATHDLDSLMCPECGLVRHYADLEE